MDADNNCMMQIYIPKSDNRIIHMHMQIFITIAFTLAFSSLIITKGKQ